MTKKILVLDCYAPPISGLNDPDYAGDETHEDFAKKGINRVKDFALKYSAATEAVIASAYSIDYVTLIDLLNGDWEKIVISGSAYSVNDKISWIQNLIRAVKETADETRAPIFGICFGAQVLAKANGGTVQKIPDDNFRKGRRELVSENGVRVPIYVSNTEFITLGEAGVVIAETDGMPEIVRFGVDSGTQYHPEVPLLEVM